MTLSKRRVTSPDAALASIAFRKNFPDREFGENAGKGLDVAGSNLRHGPKNKIVARFIAIAALA